MGKKIINLKYHRYRLNNWIIAIIVQPNKNEYVWLSFYVHKCLRNGCVSLEIIKYILYKLKGIHHIHWLPELTTFRKLSRDLNWETKHSSPFFDNCYASIAKPIITPTPLSPLFDIIISNDILKNCPSLINYKSLSEQKKVIHLIKAQYYK